MPRAAWNERLKLFATTLNAAGLAVMGFGVLGPLFATVQRAVGVQVILCLAILVGGHVVAQAVLGQLED